MAREASQGEEPGKTYFIVRGLFNYKQMTILLFKLLLFSNLQRAGQGRSGRVELSNQKPDRPQVGFINTYLPYTNLEALKQDLLEGFYSATI